MMTKKRKSHPSAEQIVLDEVRVGKGRRKRRLTKEERETLIAMYAIKKEPVSFDAALLAPPGSFLARLLTHFQNTDIPYAIPLMHTMMVAASWLTQQGAYLSVSGVTPIRPTLWTIGLAESASSKTLGTDEVQKILSPRETPTIDFFPTGGTDAQWIIDLHENNGSFWFQDEVGKFFNAVLTQSNYARIKPWMLKAYSHDEIANRLKGEKNKLTIEDPHFTLHGLSVWSTWKTDIDHVSMLDGFCQRMNFYIAGKRPDTDMFEHFLYFADGKTLIHRERLRETWAALCAQPGAGGRYTLNPHVLEYLRDWWSSLRLTWGATPLPASFIRRIGYSVLRYLVVLQFVLGKARHPIDVETAEIATRFAEYHMESALAIIKDYKPGAVNGVQKIASIREHLIADGAEPTKRNVSRRLSKGQRDQLPADTIEAVLQVLNSVSDGPGFLAEVGSEPATKTSAMIGARDNVRTRLKQKERKRNERRLRVLLNAFRKGGGDQSPVEGEENGDGGDVVSLPERLRLAG